jgi:ABC-type Na+ efflux pump permease subunit
MMVLPIVGRELRVAARRRATYRTRLWAALAAILLASWKCFDFEWQGQSTASQGRSLFFTLAWLAFAYCLLIGARVTADCISEEKREGTLGLLFLTDLKGLDVALGKLVASSLNSVYGLMAVLPLLAMPLLLGGVTLAEFLKLVLVLLNTLVFSINVGLFVSTLSQNERKASFATAVTVLGVAALPFCVAFFMAFVLEWVQSPQDVRAMAIWLVANPLYPFLLLLPFPIIGMLAIPTWTFWCAVGIVHAASWVLLLLTARLLPRIWKDRARAGKRPLSVVFMDLWQRWTLGNPAQRKGLRLALLERNPFLWLTSRDRLKPAYAWLFLLSMMAVWVWGYAQHRDVMFDFYPLVPTVILIHSFLKFWVISETSHRLVEDQRHGALELLLSTPLTAHDIVRGQRMALIRQFGRPVLVLCAVEVVVFHGAYPLAVIGPVQLMLVADLFTLLWVATRLSLSARNINEVVLKSLFFVLVLPWLAFWLTMPLVEGIVRHWLVETWDPSFSQRVAYWFAIGIVTDLALVRGWARPGLITRPRDDGWGKPGRGWSPGGKRITWRLGTEV